MQFRLVETSVGFFGYVANGRKLVATYLPDKTANVRRRIRCDWPQAVEAASLLPRFHKQVTNYYAGRPVAFTVDVDLSGLTVFRQAVLQACRLIPAGQTATYTDLARSVGRPLAARAVGSAMANNPLPLVVPCHRVLRADGALGGFSSPRGLSEKIRMLRAEGVDIATRLADDAKRPRSKLRRSA